MGETRRKATPSAPLEANAAGCGAKINMCTKNCKTCLHWRMTDRQRKLSSRAPDDAIRSCLASTPIADFKWPLSYADDGCGKWEPSPEALGVTVEEKAPAVLPKSRRARQDSKQTELG